MIVKKYIGTMSPLEYIIRDLRFIIPHDEECPNAIVQFHHGTKPHQSCQESHDIVDGLAPIVLDEFTRKQRHRVGHALLHGREHAPREQ